MREAKGDSDLERRIDQGNGLMEGAHRISRRRRRETMVN